MTKRSRRYKKLTNVIKKEYYSLAEGCKMIQQISTAKFNESINMVLNLKRSATASQNSIKGNIVLPYGTGKKIRIAVFAKGIQAKEAQEAGADIVGSDSLEKMVQQNTLRVDKIIASTEMMATIGKLGRILGPKGLMPNIKTGTITNDIKAAIQDIRMGKINFKSDKGGIIHTIIGKASFNELQLLSNIKQTIQAVIKTKKTSIKGEYIKKITLSPSMGPSIIIHNKIQ